MNVRPTQAIKFLFSDKDWMASLLWAVLFIFIPIIGPIALMGWHMEIHQRLVRGTARPIPKLDFNDFTMHLTRGVQPFVAALIVAMVFGLAFTFGVGGLMAVGGGLSAALESEVPVIIAGVITLLVMMPVTFFASAVVNAAMTRAELTENIHQAIVPAELFAYAKATWVTVLINSLIFALLAFPLALAGMFACFVGIYPAIIVLQVAAVHLRYQIYQSHLAQGGMAIPVTAAKPLASEAVRA